MSRKAIIAIIVVSALALVAGIYFAFFYKRGANGGNTGGSTVTPTGTTVDTLPGGGSGGNITPG